jgi:uncharacterized protein (UPF0548 family)
LGDVAHRMNDAALTYEPVGITGAGVVDTPAGFTRHRFEQPIGPADVFDRAREAILDWTIHRGAGLMLHTDFGPTVGQTIAMSAPLPIGWVDVACRVVAVVDEPGRAGFTYGTLPVHPERGEERFEIIIGDDNQVTFDMVVVAALTDPLGKLVPPFARKLQRDGIARYQKAMWTAVWGAE